MIIISSRHLTCVYNYVVNILFQMKTELSHNLYTQFEDDDSDVEVFRKHLQNIDEVWSLLELIGYKLQVRTHNINKFFQNLFLLIYSVNIRLKYFEYSCSMQIIRCSLSFSRQRFTIKMVL